MNATDYVQLYQNLVANGYTGTMEEMMQQILADQDQHSVDQQIGMVTAYAYAVSKGYAGTEDEFAELMANVGITLQEIETAIDTFVDETVPAAVQQVMTTGETQVRNVNAAGAEQLRGIAAEGTQQRQNVTTAGEQQVTAINNKGTEQIDAVQAKGDQVIASIPADYTELAEEVSDVKSAIDDYTYPKEYDYIFASSFPNTGKIKKEDGEPDTNSSSKYSEYIPVKAGTVIAGQLTVANNGVPIACYNQNKEFMSSVSFLNQIFSGSFTVPSGVKYVRLCYWTAYPACFVTIENFYVEGLNDGVKNNAENIENIENSLFSKEQENEVLTPSEYLSGYKVTASGIESVTGNFGVCAYQVKPGKISFTSAPSTIDSTTWTYALFDAQTLDECSQSTIIGELRFFNKGANPNSVLVDHSCLLCITTVSINNNAVATQIERIYPISEYAQNQIGQITNLYTSTKTNLVAAVNEIQRIAAPRWHINGYQAPGLGSKWFRIDAVDGCWLLLRHAEHAALYLSDGTEVKNLGAVSMLGNHKPALYCSGDWDYAITYSTNNNPPMIVQDASLFIGDSYIGLGGSKIAEQFGLQFYSSHWAYGGAGYTAKEILDMITGIPGIVSTYDPDYITAWGQGRFRRAFIFCGANIISYGSAANVETLADNTVDGNIPTNVVGSIADLLNGDSITVNGTTISTINDYYALFGNTTIGQYAFLIEYLQAVYPTGEIYMMGYVPWATHTGREEFITTVCQRLEILYGARYLNTFITTGYSKRNSSLIMYDGIHLSDAGYEIYVRNMLKWYEHSLT